MKWRKIITVGLIILFGAVFIPQWGNLADLLNVLQRGRPIWILAALGLQLLWFLNQAALYQAIYALLGLPARVRRLLPIVLASNFVNFATPTASLGAIPLFLRDAEERGLDPGKVALTNVVRLLLNLAWFSLPLSFSLVVLFLRHKLRMYHIIASSILLAVTILMVAGIVMAGLRPGGFARRLGWAVGRLNRFGERLLKRDVLSEERARTFAGQFGEAAIVLWQGRRRLPRPLIHSMLHDGLELGVLYAMYMAFPGPGAPLSLVLLVTGYTIGVLFSVVAITPQGLGVVEGALVAAFTSLGLPMMRAAVVMLAYRGLSFWLPLVAGFAALRWVHGVGKPAPDAGQAGGDDTLMHVEPE